MRLELQVRKCRHEFLKLLEREGAQFVAGRAVQRQFDHPAFELP